ncbi:hypothetical protein MHYP_G00306360 [Metynnis hypsauchen]
MVSTGPETTTSKDSTAQEDTSATSASFVTTADHKLQICSCGWRKVTSFWGLRIHQGKKRCLSKESQGPRIDLFLRKESNQSNEVHQLDENHSLESISTPVRDEENPSIELAVEETSAAESTQTPRPAVERRLPGYKLHVKWPGAAEKKVWEMVNDDLCRSLEQLRGTAEKKLENMGNIIYEYGAEHFGVLQPKVARQAPSPPVSRRQQKIKCLVQELRQLRKLWKKAPEAEKEGINILQAEIKTQLVSLRRAENFRKRRRKKEQTRTRFYKDPFKFLKTLFTKEKSGVLQTTKSDLEEHLRVTHSDPKRHEHLTIPSDIPPIDPPEHQCLYGDGVLKLPLTSLTEEFKCAKTRLQMTLNESQDPVVRENAPTLATGRKWTPARAVEEATAALRHADIVGNVQQGRGGLGLTTSRPAWRSAAPPARRKMVVEEVRRQEEAARWAKAVALGKQGRWTRWEGVEKRKMSWRDVWAMDAKSLSFTIRATYDVLPSPTNLHQWFGKDPTCVLCAKPASLRHILTGCKTSLTQGRYTWRHNQVLKILASTLEGKRSSINSQPLSTHKTSWETAFVREGATAARSNSKPSERSQLCPARDWKMLADVGKQLVFPSEIATTTLRPDLVLWSPSLRKVYMVELTVPWEDSMEEAYERKHLRYSELAAEARHQGWNTEVRPVEVGCRGFVGKSATKLLRDMGIRGQSLRTAIKAASEAAERSSQWLWLKRNDPSWAPR